MALAHGTLAAGNMRGWYRHLLQPPGAMPDGVFGPVWTVLDVSIGVSAWLLWRRVAVGAHRKRAALRIWGWQLLLNALWPAAFFGLHSPGLGMLAIVLLLAGIGATVAAFWPLERRAALLLLPYLGWVCFAAYLDAGLLVLNGA